MIRARLRSLGFAAIVMAILGSSAGSAQPGQESSDAPPPGSRQAIDVLRQAGDAVESGSYQRAVELVAPLIQPTGERPGATALLEPGDRAEAWRIYGLALFFLDRRQDAERAFLHYLKLDVEAGLDPALVPPEAIVFFEEVRSKHAAELRQYRPKPEAKRYWALNFIPVVGQLQNRHDLKGWLIAGTGAALLATNVTTYVLLDRWCDTPTEECESGGQPRNGAARTLKTINLVTGLALAGLVVYSVADGFLHYKPIDSESPQSRSTQVGLAPVGSSGAQVLLRGRF